MDVSNFAIRITLAQVGNHGLDHLVYFVSRLMSKAENNYSTTKREALGMVYSVYKFWHYLLATPFIFYVDHQALMYLVNKLIIQGRISRWLLFLQDFTFNIIVRPGKNHLIANQLSRIRFVSQPRESTKTFWMLIYFKLLSCLLGTPVWGSTFQHHSFLRRCRQEKEGIWCSTIGCFNQSMASYIKWDLTKSYGIVL